MNYHYQRHGRAPKPGGSPDGGIVKLDERVHTCIMGVKLDCSMSATCFPRPYIASVEAEQACQSSELGSGRVCLREKPSSQHCRRCVGGTHTKAPYGQKG